ncbi:MAG: hypothetical protein HMLKMBBP_03647 [Planctomycetes bacterium]|nr:hypothetical protein [Planctomycetota bacterium]
MGPASSDLVRSARAFRFAVRAAAALAALLAGAACRTRLVDPATEGPVAAEKVVSGNVNPGAPKGGGAASDDQRRAAAEAALAQAESAWMSGDPLTALAAANRALASSPPDDIAERLRAVRAKARGAVVAEKVMELRAVPEKDAVASGEPVPVRVVLRNLSNAPVDVPRRDGKSSDALFVLEIEREDWDVFGNRRASSFTVRAPLRADVDLPPGGEREAHVTIDASLLEVKHQGFSVMRIGGVLRPVVVRIGDSEFFDALPVEPALVRVFLPGWEPLAADPVASLRRAIQKRSPAHVLTATELVAAAERGEARRLLAEAADADPPLAGVCRAALARLDALETGPPPRGTVRR